MTVRTGAHRTACDRSAAQSIRVERVAHHQVPSDGCANICSCASPVPPTPAAIANVTEPAAVVKLVYTRRSGRRALTGVEVRVLSAASEMQMHSPATVGVALKLSEHRANAAEIARRLGIPRSTVREWLAGAAPRMPASSTANGCMVDHAFAELPPAYVYLLGLYLGDGCISRHPRGVYSSSSRSTPGTRASSGVR